MLNCSALNCSHSLERLTIPTYSKKLKFAKKIVDLARRMILQDKYFYHACSKQKAKICIKCSKHGRSSISLKAF